MWWARAEPNRNVIVPVDLRSLDDPPHSVIMQRIVDAGFQRAGIKTNAAGTRDWDEDRIGIHFGDISAKLDWQKALFLVKINRTDLSKLRKDHWPSRLMSGLQNAGAACRLVFLTRAQKGLEQGGEAPEKEFLHIKCGAPVCRSLIRTMIERGAFRDFRQCVEFCQMLPAQLAHPSAFRAAHVEQIYMQSRDRLIQAGDLRMLKMRLPNGDIASDVEELVLGALLCFGGAVDKSLRLIETKCATPARNGPADPQRQKLCEAAREELQRIQESGSYGRLEFPATNNAKDGQILYTEDSLLPCWGVRPPSKNGAKRREVAFPAGFRDMLSDPTLQILADQPRPTEGSMWGTEQKVTAHFPVSYDEGHKLCDTLYQPPLRVDNPTRRRIEERRAAEPVRPRGNLTRVADRTTEKPAHACAMEVESDSRREQRPPLFPPARREEARLHAKCVLKKFYDGSILRMAAAVEHEKSLLREDDAEVTFVYKNVSPPDRPGGADHRRDQPRHFAAEERKSARKKTHKTTVSAEKPRPTPTEKRRRREERNEEGPPKKPNQAGGGIMSNTAPQGVETASPLPFSVGSSEAAPRTREEAEQNYRSLQKRQKALAEEIEALHTAAAMKASQSGVHYDPAVMEAESAKHQGQMRKLQDLDARTQQARLRWTKWPTGNEFSGMMQNQNNKNQKTTVSADKPRPTPTEKRRRREERNEEGPPKKPDAKRRRRNRQEDERQMN